VRLVLDASMSGRKAQRRLGPHGRDLGGLDAVLLESNYDPEMLPPGFYAVWLNRRIRGRAGTSGNPEAAELLKAHGRRLRRARLGRLSEKNDTPGEALSTRRLLGGRPPLWVPVGTTTCKGRSRSSREEERGDLPRMALSG